MGSVLILSDFVGSADVAMAVSRAVLTRMGHRALCLPTALISNIWSQGEPAQLDTTDYLRAALDTWERRGLRPEGVLISYLAGQAQAAFVAEKCGSWREQGVKIFLDPVFADNGHLYRGIGPERLALLRGLLPLVDYVLPNATESRFLTGLSEPEQAAQALHRMGAGAALVTGVPQRGGSAVVLCGAAGTQLFPYTPVPGDFPGAGDAFAALFTGGILRGDTEAQSVSSAISTVKDWITRTQTAPTPHIGLPVELLL